MYRDTLLKLSVGAIAFGVFLSMSVVNQLAG